MKKHHYCYRIDFVEVPHVYFGSRSCDCLPEEDVKYLGSPVRHKQYWIDNTPVKTILSKKFETRLEANVYERELIKKQWEMNKSLSLNARIPGEKFCNAGATASAKTRQKQSNARKGKKHSLKHRENNSKAKKGKVLDHMFRKYVGISPEGEKIVFVNAFRFVNDNPDLGLTHTGVYNCVNKNAKKKHKSHKGWQFFYYEDFQLLDENELTVLIPKRSSNGYIGISPSGEQVFFTNAHKFCRDNSELKLYSTSIAACAKGVIKTHKGWQFFYYDDFQSINIDTAVVYHPARNGYIAISPDGDIIKFNNALQFCRDNSDKKIHGTTISACARGKRKDCKGWRFFYYDDYKALGLS